ncbi:DUF4190 domain-containing protein [Curtobacterium sp. L1-20]|uniref:DUF4190 domain-containing protein n=1 Tax=Curtobacterium sp. L1-20 TaxID=3138181 RepID=UPI003B52D8AA
MSDPYNPSQQNPPYGQHAPAYGPPTQHVVVGYQQGPPKGLSVTSMILGLVSIVAGFTFLVPLVGLILGIVGLRKEPAGRGMAITGLVLNGLFVIGWALLILFVIGIGAATTTSTYQQ